MEYMRPDMVDHDDENLPRHSEQRHEVGKDATADPQTGQTGQVPPLPPQRGEGGSDLIDHDNPRGRMGEAESIDQQRAWKNADEGTQQPYATNDPVD